MVYVMCVMCVMCGVCVWCDVCVHGTHVCGVCGEWGPQDACGVHAGVCHTLCGVYPRGRCVV